MIFMIGWAIGGVLFGVLGDRLGRAKTMMLTILTLHDLHRPWASSRLAFGISTSTGSYADLASAGSSPSAWRWWPKSCRHRRAAQALGMVQACSAVGNMLAALIGIVAWSSWRPRAPSPAHGDICSWRARCPLRSRSSSSGSSKSPIMAQGARRKNASWVPSASCSPHWRRNSMVGLLLAFAGVVGLWGIGFFSYDLLRPVLTRTFQAEGLTGAALAGKGHHVDRHHLASAEFRQLLGSPRLHLAHAPHKSPHRVRH